MATNGSGSAGRSPAPAAPSAALQGLGVALLALALPACSAIIDVEPDCDAVADCSPYVCNDENTACLSSCIDDTECGDGFVCEPGGGSCISQGCVAETEPLGLFSLSGSGFEYDVAQLGDRFFVIAASDAGVGLVELTADGELVGGDDAFVVLDSDAPAPVQPTAAANDDGAALLWRGLLDANLFDLRAFHVSADGSTRAPAVVYEGRRGQNLDMPDAAYFGDELLVVWSTFVDRVQIELLPLNGDTTFGPDESRRAPNDATVIVTSANTGSSLPAVTATSERPALARRETVSGANSVRVSFLDSGFEPINDHDVSSTPGQGIQDVMVAGMDTAVAVAWLESIEGRLALLRAVDNDNGTVLSGTRSEGTTADLRGAALAAGSSEFALAWVGDELDGETGLDVFLRRYDSTGQPLFVTFSVTGRRAAQPSRPRLVRTPEGYAAFWVEEGSGVPLLTFRRLVCDR